MSRRLVGPLLVSAMIVAGDFLGVGEDGRAIAEDAHAISAVSTHVLDTVAGLPVAGIPVRLERAGELIAQGMTNVDGRLELGPERLEPSTYQLRFDLDRYNPHGFYPEVTMTFRISRPETHLHLPLMLSPFAFTAYKGS